MTYHQYFDLFYRLLDDIHEELNTQDLEAASIEEGEELPHVSKLRDALGRLYSSPLEDLEQLSLPLWDLGVKPLSCYSLPHSGNMHEEMARFFSLTLFSTLSLPQFYELWCNILLERSVIFQSTDLTRLTFTM